MIKILFVTHYSNLYGANRSLMALILDLRKRYDVMPVLLAPRNGEMVELAEEKGVQTIVANVPFDWMRGIGTKRQKFKDFLRTVRHDFFVKSSVMPLVKKLDMDLVYCNSSVTDVGHDIAVRLQKPYIWHLREFGDKDYNLTCVLSEKKRKKKFSRANYLIAISNEIREHYKGLTAPKRLVTIYNGVDPFCRKNANQVRECVQFCVVGRLSRGKNQMEVLYAASLLKMMTTQDFCIHFVGDGDEDYVSEIRAYVNENGLYEKVKFWGYTKNVTEILMQMNVGIMPSPYEAFGRVTVEYMFAEMPVIGADGGGTKEIVQGGDTGFLYPAGDAEKLAEYMLYFINHVDLIGDMGARGKKRAEEVFSKKTNTDRIFEYVQKALDEGAI